MLEYILIGTQDSEPPTLRLLYGDAFEVVPKAHPEPYRPVHPGFAAQFIRMRQGSPSIGERIWSQEAPFTQAVGNLAYRGLVPLRMPIVICGELELLPVDEGMIQFAATWPGASNDDAEFSIVARSSARWGFVPLLITPNEQHLWLDKTRDVRPMLTRSNEQWKEGV